MFLINANTLTLESFVGDNTPPYAILSHTWEAVEVTYADFSDAIARVGLDAFAKIHNACRLAREAKIGYVWVDTCCINKDSSAELSEAINSMFRWYAGSEVCYVYLSDFDADTQVLDPGSAVKPPRWFTRGWTLQELIAPGIVEFYDKDWNRFGTKADEDLSRTLSRVTGVTREVLLDASLVFEVPVGCRMSWAAKRQTTREEDLAYCLLGLFDVNMPMLYGEGKKAFIRLQEEIARSSTDMTLFAWTAKREENAHRGVFAESPVEFARAAQILSKHDARLNEEHTLTNKGLRINTSIGRIPTNGADDVLPLFCTIQFFGGTFKPRSLANLKPYLGIFVNLRRQADFIPDVGIFVKRLGPNVYTRVRCHELAIGPLRQRDKESTIYINTRRGGRDLYQSSLAEGHPIKFVANGFSMRHLTPIAPKNMWNPVHQTWIPQPGIFRGLALLASKNFSDQVYVLLERSSKTSKPSVKLANQFLFDDTGFEISLSAVGDPELVMQQMLNNVVVFRNAAPIGVLGTSIRSVGNSYVVEIRMDTTIANRITKNLPNMDEYKRLVNVRSGVASELLQLQPRRLIRRNEGLSSFDVYVKRYLATGDPTST